jgi:hypothetical protein
VSPKAGKILLLCGLAINIVFAWWLSYDWVDMIGFSMILAGVYMHKEQAKEFRYGLLLYYSILAAIMVTIFMLWF